jgi:hypothetical protein
MGLGIYLYFAISLFVVNELYCIFIPYCTVLLYNLIIEQIDRDIFLFITTLRTSIQCHIFISVYFDYWSLAYQWFLYVPPPPFSFWNITVTEIKMWQPRTNQFRQLFNYLLNLSRVTSEGSRNNVLINRN